MATVQSGFDDVLLVGSTGQRAALAFGDLAERVSAIGYDELDLVHTDQLPPVVCLLVDSAMGPTLSRFAHRARSDPQNALVVVVGIEPGDRALVTLVDEAAHAAGLTVVSGTPCAGGRTLLHLDKAEVGGAPAATFIESPASEPVADRASGEDTAPTPDHTAADVPSPPPALGGKPPPSRPVLAGLGLLLATAGVVAAGLLGLSPTLALGMLVVLTLGGLAVVLVVLGRQGRALGELRASVADLVPDGEVVPPRDDRAVTLDQLVEMQQRTDDRVQAVARLLARQGAAREAREMQSARDEDLRAGPEAVAESES